jgi:hypothetical protein
MCHGRSAQAQHAGNRLNAHLVVISDQPHGVEHKNVSQGEVQPIRWEWVLNVPRLEVCDREAHKSKFGVR